MPDRADESLLILPPNDDSTRQNGRMSRLLLLSVSIVAVTAAVLAGTGAVVFALVPTNRVVELQEVSPIVVEPIPATSVDTPTPTEQSTPTPEPSPSVPSPVAPLPPLDVDDSDDDDSEGSDDDSGSDSSGSGSGD